MKKLSDFLIQKSSGKLVLAGLIMFVVFSIFTLPGQNELTARYSQGTGSPDTSLYYSGESIYRMAEKYGEEGRAAYINARWSFDLAFPIIYTFFFMTSISWTMARGSLYKTWFARLNLLPLFTMVFDLFENLFASIVFSAFPSRNFVGQFFSVICTPIKWIFFCSLTIWIIWI